MTIRNLNWKLEAEFTRKQVIAMAGIIAPMQIVDAFIQQLEEK